MKRNFYLQHQLMAMHDPRMQNLFDEEGPRGIGTYWIIIEKLSLLPDAKAQLKYLRSSTNKKLSITYIEKIIRNFQLFALEEDGSFSPEELNPLKKKEKKTARSDRANAVADTKNDENRQKTTEEKMEISNEKQANALNNSTDKEIGREVFKENIKDITTSATKEKKLLPLMTILIFRQKNRRIQPEVGLHSPFAMTSADRKHHCTPYVPGRKWWTDWP